MPTQSSSQFPVNDYLSTTESGHLGESLRITQPRLSELVIGTRSPRLGISSHGDQTNSFLSFNVPGKPELDVRDPIFLLVSALILALPQTTPEQACCYYLPYI